MDSTPPKRYSSLTVWGDELDSPVWREFFNVNWLNQHTGPFVEISAAENPLPRPACLEVPLLDPQLGRDLPDRRPHLLDEAFSASA